MVMAGFRPPASSPYNIQLRADLFEVRPPRAAALCCQRSLQRGNTGGLPAAIATTTSQSGVGGQRLVEGRPSLDSSSLFNFPARRATARECFAARRVPATGH